MDTILFTLDIECAMYECVCGSWHVQISAQHTHTSFLQRASQNNDCFFFLFHVIFIYNIASHICSCSTKFEYPYIRSTVIPLPNIPAIDRWTRIHIAENDPNACLNLNKFTIFRLYWFEYEEKAKFWIENSNKKKMNENCVNSNKFQFWLECIEK